MENKGISPEVFNAFLQKQVDYNIELNKFVKYIIELDSSPK